jgi:hypothetical protein
MKLINILKEADSLKKMAAEVVSILKKQWKFKSVGKVKVVPLGVSITLGDSKEGEKFADVLEKNGWLKKWVRTKDGGMIVTMDA